MVIIVAGGSGIRMKSIIPKQFMLLNNKPILLHTISAFLRYDAKMSIILVLPDEQISTWKSICNKFSFNTPHKIVKGGNTRFDSVKNGINIIDESCIIAIHDGVRPLVSNNTISNAFNAAQKFGTAIPVVAINDSIRKITKNTNKSLNRNNYKIVQTPQCFKSDILKKAYAQPYSDAFTDDASVVEKLGKKIFIIEGNIENIKITTPQDLKIAESLMK